MEQQPPFQGGEQQEQQGENRREQRFIFGPWVFNIDRAEALLAERPRPKIRLPVMPWARAYGLDVVGRTDVMPLIGPGPDFDTDYAMTTDLDKPVVVATLHSHEYGEDYPLLIDGTHRLYRAHQEGVTELPAYVLSIEESLAIREDRWYR